MSNQMCEDCHHVEAKDYWRARCQVRQKVHNQGSGIYLSITNSLIPSNIYAVLNDGFSISLPLHLSCFTIRLST